MVINAFALSEFPFPTFIIKGKTGNGSRVACELGNFWFVVAEVRVDLGQDCARDLRDHRSTPLHSSELTYGARLLEELDYNVAACVCKIKIEESFVVKIQVARYNKRGKLFKLSTI